MREEGCRRTLDVQRQPDGVEIFQVQYFLIRDVVRVMLSFWHPTYLKTNPYLLRTDFASSPCRKAWKAFTSSLFAPLMVIAIG